MKLIGTLWARARHLIRKAGSHKPETAPVRQHQTQVMEDKMSLSARRPTNLFPFGDPVCFIAHRPRPSIKNERET